MEEVKILWADDEIDLLKPHILFLEEKGYKVFTTNNGNEAIEYLEYQQMDIVFLDENMPGLSGLETLEKIKEIDSSLPVIMITKSEEEYIMEDAIGAKISDYLIKPVNPKQILLSVKKNLDKKRLVSAKTTQVYQQEFRQISMRLNDRMDAEEWKDFYKKLVHWEIELDASEDRGMEEIIQMQKTESNNVFSNFYEDNYLDWINGRDNETPIMSHTLLPKMVLPQIKDDGSYPTVLICLDNFRFDQWRAIRERVTDYFRVENEDMYYSIIPTATSFSRNALFAGLLPNAIEARFGQQWDTNGGGSVDEKQLLDAMLKLHGKQLKSDFVNVNGLEEGKKLADKISEYLHNDLLVLSFNFVDMLTHSKTDMEVIKELADDESAYRSVTSSWFEHSPLLDILKFFSEKKIPVLFTSDHGSVRVKNPVKVIGDRNTNTNLRYKIGKTLDYNAKDVFEVKQPKEAHLPAGNLSSRYIFAKSEDFFVYPNNYHHFVQHYKNTFQHGGISLEEILVPFVSLSPK